MQTKNFGEKINNIIGDAMKTMDFDKLSRDINRTVRDALFNDEIKLSKDDVNENAGKAGKSGGSGGWYNPNEHTESGMWDMPRGNYQTSAGNVDRRRNKKAAKKKKPAGTYSGPLMMVFGILFAVSGIGNCIDSIGAGSLGSPFISYLIMTVVAAAVAIKGFSLRKRLKRFQRYSDIMRNSNDYYEIENLAMKCHLEKRETLKDLKSMIKAGMFPEGHIDDSEKWFIPTDDMYDRYIQARSDYNERQQKTAEERAREMNESEQERRLREVLEKGKESLEEIRAANVALPGEEISNQLDRLEELVIKIFKRVEEKPALLPDIRKFMDYYLPTTVKLVNAYRSFENKALNSDEVAKAKKEIENTLSSIELAFRKLLSELYEDTIMDISTDISVLKTMFARDGLAGDDFASADKKQEE